MTAVEDIIAESIQRLTLNVSRLKMTWHGTQMNV